MSGCRKGDYEMTTANNIKGQNLDINEELITALYCRLSVEDMKDDKDKKRKNKDCALSFCKDFARSRKFFNLFMF